MQRIQHPAKTKYLQIRNCRQPLLSDQNQYQRTRHCRQPKHASESHQHGRFNHPPVGLFQAFRILLDAAQHRITDPLHHRGQIAGKYRIELLRPGILS